MISIYDIYCTTSAEVDDRRDGADGDNDERESADHVERAVQARQMPSKWRLEALPTSEASSRVGLRKSRLIYGSFSPSLAFSIQG